MRAGAYTQPVVIRFPQEGNLIQLPDKGII